MYLYVDDVFKEKVDDFIIESGVQSLNIRQRTSSWCINKPSNSNSQQWTSPAKTSSTSCYDWKASDIHKQGNGRIKPSFSTTGQSWWQLNQIKSAVSLSQTAKHLDFTSSDVHIGRKQEGPRTNGDHCEHKL